MCRSRWEGPFYATTSPSVGRPRGQLAEPGVRWRAAAPPLRAGGAASALAGVCPPGGLPVRLPGHRGPGSPAEQERHAGPPLSVARVVLGRAAIGCWRWGWMGVNGGTLVTILHTQLPEARPQF